MESNATEWSSVRSRTTSTSDSLNADSNGEVVSEEVIELLEDDHARAMLTATVDTEMSARELVETVSASRATVYRRLNSLEEAGLVETGVELDADGHHREVYSAAPSRITVSIGPDGLSVRRAGRAD